MTNNKIAIPNFRQIEWYEREKSVFFHFGMNTFTDKEWGDGTESPELFNPTEVDCRQWIKIIKDAGFTSAILTAKHHDGFCLWPTKYTKHSVKYSPYKNGQGDIVKEFTEACNEFGIKAGIYLSPWDRHEKTWGTDDYNDFYVGQLEELLTNYGKIWECWWDGAGSSITKYDFKRWSECVRKYQQDAVIFGTMGAAPYVDVRWVGNENGIAGNPCWGSIKEDSIMNEITKDLNCGDAYGERFVPAESDVSIRPGWFFHSKHNDYIRTPENLLKVWFSSVGRNAGLLLNIPPNRNGQIEEQDKKSLIGFSKLLKNGFKHNLIENAKVRVVSDNKNISEEKYNEDVIEFIYEYEQEIQFNTIMISEDIINGHRVRGFEVYVGNGFEEMVYSGECIGYKFANHFETYKTKRIKLKITKSFGTPIIKFFGVYNFDKSYFNEENAHFSHENIMRNGLAVLERKENEINVNLGGIIPYNKIVLSGNNVPKFELLIFDGSNFKECHFELITTEENVVCKFKDVIDWSYMFKVKIIEDNCINDLDVEVYYE